MIFIYKIQNQINKKIYIGSTKDPERRWFEHKQSSKLKSCKSYNYPLQTAIRKYGVENFYITLICECDISELDELEIFYIKKYDSYNNGYNLTLGGQGNRQLIVSDEDVITKYHELGYINKTAEYFDCSEPTISKILHKHNIEIKRHYNPTNQFKPGNNSGVKFTSETNSKKIKIVELNKEFESMVACGQWMIDNNYSDASTAVYAGKSISRVLNGERKTYCKLHFEYC